MKIVTIVGARPQFIKCALVSRELRKEHEEILVHTGQHYDPEMSDIFFNELQIPKPNYNLDVGSGSHGKQTAEILAGVEEVPLRRSPTSCLCMATQTRHWPGRWRLRRCTSRLLMSKPGSVRSTARCRKRSTGLAPIMFLILFCPTETAVKNLAAEGITNGVHLVGDVMADVLGFNREIAKKKSRILETLSLMEGTYDVLTIHRASNTDNRENLTNIINAVGEAGMPVIFPVHPRTRNYLEQYGLSETMRNNVHLIEPLGYLDIIRLMGSAEKIITDSGGIQKEAYILGIPCITLRDSTEWIETLHDGWNVLVATDPRKIIAQIHAGKPLALQKVLFSTGATCRIGTVLKSFG